MTDEEIKRLPRYIRVGFHVDADGYLVPCNWSAEQRDAFHAEALELFNKAGWKQDGFYYVKGVSELYPHPQQFSGTVLEELIPEVTAILKNAKTFRLRKDMYGEDMIRRGEVCHVVDKEMQTAHVQSRRAEVEERIKTLFKTRDRRTYVYCVSGIFSALEDVVKAVRLSAIDRAMDYAAFSVVYDVLEDLVNSGEIISYTKGSRTGYRTRRPKEKAVPI